MEKIDDKGRMGKEYKPFPVKYKSKYVPIKLPSKIDIMRGEFCLVKNGNSFFGDGCELQSFECFAVFMFNLPIYRFL